MLPFAEMGERLSVGRKEAYREPLCLAEIWGVWGGERGCQVLLLCSEGR